MKNIDRKAYGFIVQIQGRAVAGVSRTRKSAEKKSAKLFRANYGYRKSSPYVVVPVMG